jgi:hypothetical protein
MQAGSGMGGRHFALQAGRLCRRFVPAALSNTPAGGDRRRLRCATLTISKLVYGYPRLHLAPLDDVRIHRTRVVEGYDSVSTFCLEYVTGVARRKTRPLMPLRLGAMLRYSCVRQVEWDAEVGGSLLFLHGRKRLTGAGRL